MMLLVLVATKERPETTGMLELIIVMVLSPVGLVVQLLLGGGGDPLDMLGENTENVGNDALIREMRILLTLMVLGTILVLATEQ
ncbi:unnamed protein product [Cuscuta campestris]|uniref:Uncharacterized protein n=1 Tax=Cuscuta campestris TaxID=132261 RepID=A0A484NE18_9ASTE|nr:unnamed protein product [Cuscuta campestris]